MATISDKQAVCVAHCSAMDVQRAPLKRKTLHNAPFGIFYFFAAMLSRADEEEEKSRTKSETARFRRTLERRRARSNRRDGRRQGCEGDAGHSLGGQGIHRRPPPKQRRQISRIGLAFRKRRAVGRVGK